jgi:hypothetical protein
MKIFKLINKSDFNKEYPLLETDNVDKLYEQIVYRLNEPKKWDVITYLNGEQVDKFNSERFLLDYEYLKNF